MSAPDDQRIRVGVAAAAGALFFASGAAGLIYEVLWFRLLLLRLGGTGLSVATVTAAFMAGLGLGAWLAGTRIELRIRPLAAYGILEILIGAYALAVPTLIAWAGHVDAALFGAEPGALGRLIGFFLAGAVLLPPTLCMGATLPILSRLVAGTGRTPGRFVGVLYGLNTIGAVLGAWATGFLFMPRVGLSATIAGAAILNLTLGVMALALARRTAPVDRAAAEPAEETLDAHDAPESGAALTASFGTGLIGFVLQVAWTRILALVFGSSVYAFSLILVVFLLGLGAGAVAAARLADRIANPRRALAYCITLAGAAALLGQGLYGVLPRVYLDAIAATGQRQALGGALWMAAAIMLPATLLLGAAFPLVIRLATGDRDERAARGVGRIYAANTAGGVLGAYTTALWLVPAFGLAGAVTAGATALLILGAALAFTGRPRALPVPAAAAAVFLAWFFAVPGWDRGLMSMGVGIWGARANADGRDVQRELQSLSRDRVLYYRDGVTSTIAVKEATVGDRTERYMSVDGKIDASNGGDMPTQLLGGQLPVLAAGPRATDVMVVGYASGVSVGSVLTHPVASVTVVEIEGVVEDASHFFDDVNHTPLRDPRTRLVINDARAYLERTDRRFDVIISEPSSAWLSGPSKLFTLETFQAIRARLKPGGVLGQWLQTYDLGPDDVFTVIRTLRQVFPRVAVFRLLGGADLLLLASDRDVTLDLGELDAAWAREPVRADLLRVGVRGPCDILDRVVAEPAAVDAAIGTGPLNTDDNALLEYHGAQRVGSKGDVEALTRLTANSRGAAAMIRNVGAVPLGALSARCWNAESWDAARSLAAAALAAKSDPDALWVTGEAARADGNRPSALERFGAALQLDPHHAPSRISIALTLQELDRSADAREAWTRAEQDAPNDPIIPAFRGVARFHLRDYAGAAADFRRARSLTRGQPPPLRLDLYEGAALQESGDAQSARRLLEQAAAEFPENTPPGTEGIAAIERLARALQRDPQAQSVANQLASRAKRERDRVIPAILEESARLASELGETAARGYLRNVTALDPALQSALESALATQQPSSATNKLSAILQSLREGR